MKCVNKSSREAARALLVEQPEKWTEGVTGFPAVQNQREPQCGGDDRVAGRAVKRSADEGL